MKAILNFEFLLPITVLLLQVFIVLYICILILRKIGILKQPLGGLEYSHAFFATATIFSVLLISTAGASAMFQTFKTYQNQSGSIWQLYLAKSGQFFLVVLFFELLLGMVILLLTKTSLFVGNGLKEILDGNIPAALVTSCIVLGFAIVLRVMASEIMEYITPQYLNFR